MSTSCEAMENVPRNPSVPTIATETPPPSDDSLSPVLSISPHKSLSPLPSPDHWNFSRSFRSADSLLIPSISRRSSASSPPLPLISPIPNLFLLPPPSQRASISLSFDDRAALTVISSVHQLPPRARSLDTKKGKLIKQERLVGAADLETFTAKNLKSTARLTRKKRMKSETSLTAVTFLPRQSSSPGIRVPSRSRFVRQTNITNRPPTSTQLSLPGSTELHDQTEKEISDESPSSTKLVPNFTSPRISALPTVSEALAEVFNTVNSQLDHYLTEIRKRHVEPFYEEVTEDDLRRLSESEDRWDNFLFAIDKALHNCERELVELDGFDAGKISLFNGHKNIQLKEYLQKEPKEFVMFVYFGSLHTPASTSILREILIEKLDFLGERHCTPTLVTTADFEVAESWVQPVTEVTGVPVSILQDKGEMREKLTLPISMQQSSSMEVIHLLASDLLSRRRELPKLSEDSVTELEDAHQTTAVIFCNRQGKVVVGHRMQSAIERLDLDGLLNSLNHPKEKPLINLSARQQQLLEAGLKDLVLEDPEIKQKLTTWRNLHRKINKNPQKSRTCAIL